MDDENKVEEVKEEAEEAADEAKDAAEEAKEAAGEAKEAADDAKEAVEEVKEEVKQEEKKEEAKPEIKVSGKLKEMIEDIEKLSVLELSELVKALENRFGVSAAAPVAVAGAAPTGGEEAADEGQTTFNVVLTDGGANKISVIKAVRELVPTLGLKEAKDLVDGAPKQVLEGVGKDAAGEAKKKLETAGGKVELK